MRNLLFTLLTIICLITAPTIFANPPGHFNRSGFNHGPGFNHREDFGIPGSEPPGLAKKGHPSYGLVKKDKVPPGWNKGEKEGWENEGIFSPSLFRHTRD